MQKQATLPVSGRMDNSSSRVEVLSRAVAQYIRIHYRNDPVRVQSTVNDAPEKYPTLAGLLPMMALAENYA
ncbi:hypothetical protein HWI79_1260 [Cryptosporidium felis]|nr:hypothetical protein HWI79_1260 [Cryptosporidium felis]